MNTTTTAFEATTQAGTLAAETHSFPGLIQSPQDRAAFRAHWKTLADQRALTPKLMACRALLLGAPLAKAFSPVTNAKKLANGHGRWAGLRLALEFGIPKTLDELAFDREALVEAMRAKRSLSDAELEKA